MLEINEDEVLDYLEHHGVKGMRWGTRKAASTSSAGGESRGAKVKKALTSDTAKKAYIVSAVVGAVVAQQVLKQRKQTRLKNLRMDQVHRNNHLTLYNMIQTENKGGAHGFKESFSDLKNMQKSRNMSDGDFSSFLSRRFFATSEAGHMTGTARTVPKRVMTGVKSEGASLKKLKSEINTLYDAANADLRKRDIALQIPYSARTYLKKH
jgi:hypothetical protein